MKLTDRPTPLTDAFRKANHDNWMSACIKSMELCQQLEQHAQALAEASSNHEWQAAKADWEAFKKGVMK